VKWLVLAALIAGSAAGLTACGDDDAPPPATTPTASASASPAATVTVSALPTATLTVSMAPTATRAATATTTPNATPTSTAAASASPAASATPATATATVTATATATVDPREVRIVLEDLPGALLSISGRGHDEVYAVGADPGDGLGPMVLHWNGRYWRRLRSGVSGNLWWISETPVAGSFIMAGEGGLLLSFEPDTGRFDRLPTPGEQTLFGAWAAGDRHMWSVGGDMAAPDDGGVVLVRDPPDETAPPGGATTSHLGGVDWSVDTEAPKAREQGLPTLFKVWGADASDVWVSGREGLALHFDGLRWSVVETGVEAPLLTVHGNGDEVVTVGGSFDGVILELEEGRFVDRAPLGLPNMNGIFVASDGAAVAVGRGGTIARRSGGVWTAEDTPLNPFYDYHAVWIDPRGGIWMVGGDLSTDLDSGALAYAGGQNVSGEIAAEVPCPPGEAQGGATTVSYGEDIVPLLQSNGCLNSTCHAGLLLSSEYDLSAWQSTFGPGQQAAQLGLCNVVPGKPEESYLIEKITNPRLGQRMPNALPPLEAAEIGLIETWIREGARDDSGERPTATPTATPPATNTPSQSDCAEPGIICTVAGTGMSVFDGDGRDALDTSFYYPLDVSFQPDGLPVIIDWNNLRGRRIEPDGTVATIIGTGFEANPEDGSLATETSLHHASELAFDALGRMLVAGNHVPFVFRVGLDQRVEIVAGDGEFTTAGDGGPALEASWVSPYAVLPDGAGGFWVSDVDGHTIRYVDAGGIVSRVAGDATRGYSGDGGAATAAQLNGPTKMAFDAAGDLIFCDTDNHVLRRILGDGSIETFAGTGVPGWTGDGGAAAVAQLWRPYDVAVAADGTIYVADSGNDVVRAIELDGSIRTVAGTGVAGYAGDRGPAAEARLRRPSGLVLDAAGGLWIADTLNHRVRVVAGVE
jgi:hypothetical protein